MELLPSLIKHMHIMKYIGKTYTKTFDSDVGYDYFQFRIRK